LYLHYYYIILNKKSDGGAAAYCIPFHDSLSNKAKEGNILIYNQGLSNLSQYIKKIRNQKIPANVDYSH